MNPTGLKARLPARLQLYARQVAHAGLAQDTGREFVDPLQAIA